MYTSGNLPGNLASFCAFLRREHRFRIGAGELIDAARALDVIDLTNRRSVQSALRAVLASTHDEALAFDVAFNRFFFPSEEWPGLDRAADLPSEIGDEPAGPEAYSRGRSTDRAATDLEEAGGASTGRLTPLDSGDDDAEASVTAGTYSPIGVESGEVPVLEEASQPWVDAARLLVRRVHLGLSRRLRPAARGPRFDLRRTLRASLQTGGELLAPRWLGRPPRTPRFVLLVDGSRSMAAYAETALTIAAALMRATARVEIFTFSTALERVTPFVRRLVDGVGGGLPPLRAAWGGGTAIGAALGEFLRRFGERLLNRDTVVFIVSDGLDVGDQPILLHAMRTLQRRAAAVVWLNPLVDTSGYEPTAAGMRTARPFVSTLTSVNAAPELLRLARTLRLKR